MKSILVVVAHSDDQIIGPGATLAKYSSEGYNIYTVIFSYGELSHPHLNPEHISKVRHKEALKADKIIGGKGVTILGFSEGQFLKEKEKAIKIIKKIIIKEKPEKIFTHSPDDPNGDHRAVFKTVINAYDEIKPKSEVYTFDIWNPINFSTKAYPKLIVDSKKYFEKKRKALNAFRSQKHALTILIWAIYLRALINGIRYKKLLAEVFYKIR